MLLKTRVGVSGLLVALFLCLLAANAQAALKVVAKVGSVPITQFELNQKLNQLIPFASNFHSGVSNAKVSELREQAFEELVESAMMTQYAIENELVVPKAEIDKDMERIRSSFPSQAEFKKALGNLSVSDVRAAIYRKFLADKALKVAVEDKVNVSESSLEKYFDQNKERFVRPRQFRASHILLKVDPAASKEERQKVFERAEQLLAKAKAGEDFYNLAYYNSDHRTKFVGGDLGLFHKGQIQEEIEAELLKMKVGEISGPVKSLYGYHIVKMTEDNPERQMTFEEMRPKLIESERKEQYEKLKVEWLNSLKGKYQVEHLAK